MFVSSSFAYGYHSFYVISLGPTQSDPNKRCPMYLQVIVIKQLFQHKGINSFIVLDLDEKTFKSLKTGFET